MFSCVLGAEKRPAENVPNVHPQKIPKQMTQLNNLPTVNRNTLSNQPKKFVGTNFRENASANNSSRKPNSNKKISLPYGEVLSEEELDKFFWQKKVFGVHSPESLINTLWYFNTTNFKNHDIPKKFHYNLLWGDIVLIHESGESYLKYCGHQGHRVKVPSNSNPEKCPVRTYIAYAAARPSHLCKPTDPFYLFPNTEWTQGTWFSNTPIGQKSLSKIKARVCLAAGVIPSVDFASPRNLADNNQYIGA